MSTQTFNSEAAMNDHRFERPLLVTDEFREIPLMEHSFDLFRLKKLAEQKGKERADYIRKNLGKESIAIKVFHFLTMNRYRRGSMKFIEQEKEKFLKQIEDSISLGLPIEIVISFFGYKALNPLKTWGIDGTEVDISEVGSILRFYEICVGIKELYPQGSCFKIACDGLKYSNAVGFTPEQGHGYYEKVKCVVDYLGISSQINVLEESDFFPSDYKIRMDLAEQKINNIYYYEPREGNEPVINLIDALKRSIIYTIPFPQNYRYKTIVHVFSASIPDHELKDMNLEAYSLRLILKEQALKRAIKYVAAYDAIKEYGVMEKIAPRALRGTVHPKAGQIGLYALNKQSDNLFPHHGQGVSTDYSLNPDIDDIRVRFRADISRTDLDLVGLILPKKEYPFADGHHPFIVVDRKFLEA